MSDYPGKACSSSCTCRKSSSYSRSNRFTIRSQSKASLDKKVNKPAESKEEPLSDWRVFVSEFMRNLLGLDSNGGSEK